MNCYDCQIFYYLVILFIFYIFTYIYTFIYSNSIIDPINNPYFWPFICERTNERRNMESVGGTSPFKKAADSFFARRQDRYRYHDLDHGSRWFRPSCTFSNASSIPWSIPSTCPICTGESRFSRFLLSIRQGQIWTTIFRTCHDPRIN